MRESIKMVTNAEVNVFDKNGVKLQFDNCIYLEGDNEFKILQDGEEVFSGNIDQVDVVIADFKEDIVYI